MSNSLRIGFDAKRLFHNRTGLGVYSRLLLEELGQLAPHHDYVLYDRRPSKSSFHGQFRKLDVRKGSGPLWRSWRLSNQALRDGCQLFHGLSHELPRGSGLRKMGTIVTIHDLIFERFPHLYPAIDRAIYRAKWKHACKNADVIVSISQSTKTDLVQFYGVDDQKIRIIPPMHDRRFEQRQDRSALEEIRKRYNLPKEYLLYVGAIVPRKGLERIIRALAQLKGSKRPALVIVGSGKKYLKQCKQTARDLRIENCLHWCNYVDNEDLPPIYQMATALVYPSLFEGFGIPVVESLYAGTPVITSNTSSLPEAAGGGAILVNPKNLSEISDAMRRLLEDSSLRKDLVTQSEPHLQRIQNQALAQHMLSLYEELAASRNLQ